MVERKETGLNEPVLDDQYDVVVIGAGIGGLTCGALLAKEGLNVLVVERRNKPGGYVSAYERKGYSFQGPSLVGACGPGQDIARVVDHLGLKVDFKRVEPFLRFVYPDHDIKVSGEVEEYKEVLKENFQPQTTNINHFFKVLENVQKGMDLRIMRRPRTMGTLARGLSYPFRFPRTPSLMWGRSTLEGILDKYLSDEKLKTVLATPWPFLGSPPWELSAIAMIGMLKSFSGGAYVPIGGYQEFSDQFAKSIVDSGGTLFLRHEVTKVNTEQGMVTEVEMQPRAKVFTGIVVSDSDTKRTFLNLLDRENFTRAFLERIEGYELSMSGFVVHLGMAKRVGDEDLSCGTVFVQPSYDDREMLEEVGVTDRFPDPARIRWAMSIHSLQDPSLAPEGRTCLDVRVPRVPYGFQQRWGVGEGGRRGERYRRVRDKYAEVVVEAVNAAFPRLVERVEAYESSTPISYERYNMAADGCWYDGALVPGQVLRRRPGPATPVRGFYLTGSKSVLGGGIHSSIMGGVLAADLIMKGKFGPLLS